MNDSMKIRAIAKDGVTEIKAVIPHPMETGLRKDPQTGKVVPAHFINMVTVTVNGKTVLTSRWGGGIAKNPYLSIKVAGVGSGDKVVLAWEDNRSQSGLGEAVIR